MKFFQLKTTQGVISAQGDSEDAVRLSADNAEDQERLQEKPLYLQGYGVEQRAANQGHLAEVVRYLLGVYDQEEWELGEATQEAEDIFQDYLNPREDVIY